MRYTFLELKMEFVPQSTKDNVPTFGGARFSNDNKYLILDGYNESGMLVHPDVTLEMWLQWEENPVQAKQILLDNAVEYTKEEFLALTKDVNSPWYQEPRSDV